MKNIIAFVVCVFAFFASANPAGAQIRVGAILNGPGEIVSDSEQLEKLDIKLAELLPANKYEVLPVRDMLGKEKDYRRNHNIFQAPNQLSPQPLSMEARCELGKESNCDYIMSVNMQSAEGKSGFFMIEGEKRMDLLTDLVITDISAKRDVFQKQYKTGGMDAGPVFTRTKGDAGKAMIKAFDKFLKKLVIVPEKDIP